MGKLRDELLNREIFYTLEEAKVLIEDWRRGGMQHGPSAQQSWLLAACARGFGVRCQRWLD